MLIPGQHIHIVGIAGFGMSAIARVLVEHGYKVSGSDQQTNALVQALQQEGVTVYQGHRAENIDGAEMVIFSSAVPENNPEIQAARHRRIQVMNRREFMPIMMEGQQTIGIAGTHGKTTTTAMLTHVLIEAGMEPSYIVGGVMRNNGRNAGAGSGEHFIIEADEYDNMFLGLQPAIAVINNIEYDHPDFFLTPADMLKAFQTYANRVEPEGLLVVNADDDVARTLGEERRANLQEVQMYGIENNAADYWATDLKPLPNGGMEFMVSQGAVTGGLIGKVKILLPGRHNVQNAMGVITVARHLGVAFEVIVDALATFKGTGRRSEVMGVAGGVTVINDYAHHPTAIRVTLKAWRDQPGIRELWAVWQPHTYSRTRSLADIFKGSFNSAHHALVTDIYAAREKASPGLMAKDMVGMIQSSGHPDARYSGDLLDTAQILANEVKPGDVVVLLTAGDAPRIGQALLDVLKKR